MKVTKKYDKVEGTSGGDCISGKVYRREICGRYYIRTKDLMFVNLETGYTRSYAADDRWILIPNAELIV